MTWRDSPYARVRCMTCGARPGQRCRTSGDRIVSHKLKSTGARLPFHEARIKRVNAALAWNPK